MVRVNVLVSDNKAALYAVFGSLVLVNRQIVSVGPYIGNHHTD